MASIRRRENGRWRARYRDDAGREHAKHFERKVDAQRWLDEVTAAVVTGMYVDPRAGRVTFDAFFAEWASRQVWEGSTVRTMAGVRRAVTFGDVPLVSLRASHFEAWVKAQVAAGMAPVTIASRMSAVRSVLRAAVRDRVIPVDPSQGVALPRQRRAEHAMQIPTPAEVGALLAAADDYQRPMWALAAFAGLRLGETSAVQVDDVDFLRRQMHVRRQAQATKGGVEVRAPKYGSERTVYLPDGLLELLSVHLETYGVGSGRWLVMGPSGGPPPPTTVHGWWQRTQRAAGVRGVRLHSMRHFYASGLIAAGCDVVTVQRAMGHSKATTTLNTYSHLWPSAEDRTRTAAGSMFDEATGRAAPADSLRTGLPG